MNMYTPCWRHWKSIYNGASTRLWTCVCAVKMLSCRSSHDLNLPHVDSPAFSAALLVHFWISGFRTLIALCSQVSMNKRLCIWSLIFVGFPRTQALPSLADMKTKRHPGIAVNEARKQGAGVGGLWARSCSVAWLRQKAAQ